jgi:hypothetical protein
MASDAIEEERWSSMQRIINGTQSPESTEVTLSDAKDFVAMPSDLVGDIKFFLEQMCRYSLMSYGDRVKMANGLIERMDKIK